MKWLVLSNILSMPTKLIVSNIMKTETVGLTTNNCVTFML